MKQLPEKIRMIDISNQHTLHCYRVW